LITGGNDMKNKLSLIGVIGLLGLLGFVTDNPGFYGFFGFFGFFGFASIEPDETFQTNLNKAGKNAFFTGMIMYPIFITIGAFTSFAKAYAFGFAISFALQLIVFTVSLTHYENKGV